MNRYQHEMDQITVPEATRAALFDRAAAASVRPRIRWRTAILAAAVVCLLTCVVCAAALQSWLEPVVRSGSKEPLIEDNTVSVNQTVSGVHCDVTLDLAVTDGDAVYAQFTARYDAEFMDPDDAIMFCGFHYGDGWSVQSAWRTDDGSEPGVFRFIAVTAENYSDGLPIESILGKTIDLELYFLDDGRTGIMEEVETYAFTFPCNETIRAIDAAWADGTALHATPLTLDLYYTEEMPDPTSYVENAGLDSIQLEYMDGSQFSLADALPQQAQQNHLRCVRNWDRTTPDGRQDTSFCRLSILLPELTDPDAIAAIMIYGQRYDLSEAVCPAQ